MKLTRRHFLAWAGLSAVGAVACEGFGIREGELDIQSPAALPEDLVRGKDNWYASLCRTCAAPEGILVRVMEGRAKKVQGNPLYPTNQGKSHARCEAGVQALYHPDRVPGPMRRSGARGSGQFSPIPWQPAGMDLLRTELLTRGPASVMATEPLRGHLALLTERFSQAIGARRYEFAPVDDGVYRRAMQSVYGQTASPDFDIDNAKFLISFGADFLSTWLAPTRMNRGYGEFRQGAGRERGKFYQVDSRFSMTAANADKWVPVTPGWEGHLALSLAQVIVSEGLQAPGVEVNSLLGGGAGRAALDRFTPENVAGRIGLPDAGGGAEFIRQLARDFAGNRPSLALGGGAAGAGSNGLNSLEAIYALNLLVGSDGAEGGVKFNPASPWNEVPASSSPATLDDWVRVADQIRSGELRMLLLHNADLVHGLPDALRLREAIEQADDLFIVSFSPFIDDTSALADLLLPDRAALEDWGDDIPEPGPGYQMVGWQQPVVNPLYDLDPLSFPDVLLAMGEELGRTQELPWRSYQAMLQEAADTLFAENRGSVDGATAAEFWTNLLRRGGWWDESRTGDSAARPEQGILGRVAQSIAEPAFVGYAPGPGVYHLVPFSHNTLADGANAHLPWLQAAPDPISTIAWQTWVEMHDSTAAALGVREGDVVRIESPQGSIRALAYPSPATPPEVVCIPFGGGRRHGSSYATDRPGTESANVMDLLEPQRVGSTGALAWAATRVRLYPTGESVNVAKLEGSVRSVEVGLTAAEEIIKTIHPDNL